LGVLRFRHAARHNDHQLRDFKLGDAHWCRDSTAASARAAPSTEAAFGRRRAARSSRDTQPPSCTWLHGADAMRRWHAHTSTMA
jgi:hypothetical protein